MKRSELELAIEAATEIIHQDKVLVLGSQPILGSFHESDGFYIQGVGSRTAILPRGWKARLVPVVPPGAPQSAGLCLDPLDLCASKLVANREKDVIFVGVLIGAGLIAPARKHDVS